MLVSFLSFHHVGARNQTWVIRLGAKCLYLLGHLAGSYQGFLTIILVHVKGKGTVCVCVCVSLCVYLSVYAYVCVCMSVCVSVCLYL